MSEIYILDVGYIYLDFPLYILDFRYIYIGLPIYILDFRYIYWTSDIDIGRPI